MLASILVLVVSVLVFLLVLGLLRVERNRGKRIFIPRVRTVIDSAILWVANGLDTMRLVVGRFVLQLGLRYTLHIVLKSVLLGIANLYDRLMSYFEYNRQRTKAIRKAKRAWGEGRRNHLTELQEHRNRHALTDDEKRARKEAALEGK